MQRTSVCKRTSLAYTLSVARPAFRGPDFRGSCCARHRRTPSLLPSIKVTIDITFDVDAPDLSPLSVCIVDLDPNCSEARLVFTYGPRPTAPATLFADLAVGEDLTVYRSTLFRALDSRVSAHAALLEAVDPNDLLNRKSFEPKTHCASQRQLQQRTARPRRRHTSRARRSGKSWRCSFNRLSPIPSIPRSGRRPSSSKAAGEQIPGGLHPGFYAKLTSLLPTFDLFGYPGH